MEGTKEKKETFNLAIWVLLLTGAGMIDGIQSVLTPTGIGLIVSIVLDFVTAVILFTIFFFGGIRDKKVLFSVLAGLGLGVFSAGMLPSWVADVGFAWLVTDGKEKISSVPVVGETAGKAITIVASKKSGKLPPKLD